MPFSVAIVGKTNVGKSTLFNAIAGKKFAIADNQPGVTRDRKEVWCEISDCKFLLVDTAGLEKITQGSISRYLKNISDRNKRKEESEMYDQMIEQSIEAIKLADLVLFMVDGVAGVTDEDYYFADIARRSNNNILLVINKCESEKRLTISQKEISKFGFRDYISISAEHRIGLDSILSEIYDTYQAVKDKYSDEEKLINDLQSDEKVSIAIIGRPNAGKSTLINTILGQKRLITGEKAGITRDTIAIDISYKDRPIRLIDTAGVRRQSHVNLKGGDEIEKRSIYETFRMIRLCHVAILVVDVMDPFVMQDVKLAGKVIEEGRNLIICMNKWDKITDEEYKTFVIKRLQDHLKNLIPDVPNPRFVLVSGLTGFGLDDLFEAVFDIYTNWNKRIKTSVLNEWISIIQKQHPIRKQKGRDVKIKYATQIKTRPPLISLFTNTQGGIEDTYLKFLKNRLAEDFNLQGIPIRFKIIGSNNPYSKKN